MMNINNHFLYFAVFVVPQFVNDIGDVKKVHGTGFFVQNKHGHICFVTNRHLLDPSYKAKGDSMKGYELKNFFLGVSCIDKTTNEPNISKIFGVSSEVNKVIFDPNPDNDLAVIKKIIVEELDIEFNRIHGGTATIDYVFDYDKLADRDYFKNFLNISDRVAFTGFPEHFDVKGNRPILRSGFIASDPRYEYNNEDISGECFLYEALSTGGASGSPICAVNQGKVIGVNAGHLYFDKTPRSKNLHAHLSYCYKSYLIKELID